MRQVSAAYLPFHHRIMWRIGSRIVCLESRIAIGIATCYPHLKRKASQGEYLSTQHCFFETFLMIIDAVHLAHSYNMMARIIQEAGPLFDKHMKKEPKLRRFWNSYMVAPWDCWCVALHEHTPLTISNNQPIESWHKYGTRRRTMHGRYASNT